MQPPHFYLDFVVELPKECPIQNGMAFCHLSLEFRSYFCHPLSVKVVNVLPRVKKWRHRPYLLMKESHVLKVHVVWEILVQTSLGTIACHRCWSSSYLWSLTICSLGQICAYEYEMLTDSVRTDVCMCICKWGDTRCTGWRRTLDPWPLIFMKAFSGWPLIDKRIKGRLLTSHSNPFILSSSGIKYA